VLARELTKMYEEFIRGFAEEVLENLGAYKLKGEMVLMVAGTQYKPNLTRKDGK